MYSSGKGLLRVSNNPLRTLRMVWIYNLWTQRRLDEVLWNDNFDHKKLWLCGVVGVVVVVGGERGLDKSDRSWWASWARRRGRCMMIRRCRQWGRHLSTGRKERSLRDLSRPLIGQNPLSRPLIGQNPPPPPPGRRWLSQDGSSLPAAPLLRGAAAPQ